MVPAARRQSHREERATAAAISLMDAPRSLRRALLLPLLCVSLISGWGCFSSDGPQHGRLNVLFISVDDLRPELGTYGAPAVTPNIDRLAAQGIRFDRAFAAAAACAPSRASMLSGAYPHTTHVYSAEPPLAEANPELTNMPQVFKDAGYETMEIGKFVHASGDAPGAWSQERWVPDVPRFPRYLAPENRDKTGVKGRRGPFAEAVDVPDDAYYDGKLATRAIEELRRVKDRPFFLALGFLRPHLPFNCPKKYWNLYDPGEIRVPGTEGMRGVARAEFHKNYEVARYAGGRSIREPTGRRLIHGYRACVSYVDAQVGRILNELERLNLADHTLVVLWGDHGWHLGEHGIWGKNTALEPALRIPLIVRVPGIPGGRSTAALVETVDLLPTLCDLSGIEVPPQVEGVSFVPLLKNPRRPWKQAVFGWRHRGDRTGYTVRTPRYRFVRWVAKAGDETKVYATELYDHQSDPREYVNVADRPGRRGTVQRLGAMLDAWLRHEPVGWPLDVSHDPRIQ